MKTIIRQANIKDAPIIAQVIGMGFGEDLLRQYCGINGLAIMEALAKMEDSQYSYHHALIAEVDGQVAGGLVGYTTAHRYNNSDAPPLPILSNRQAFFHRWQKRLSLASSILIHWQSFPSFAIKALAPN